MLREILIYAAKIGIAIVAIIGLHFAGFVTLPMATMMVAAA